MTELNYEDLQRTVDAVQNTETRIAAAKLLCIHGATLRRRMIAAADRGLVPDESTPDKDALHMVIERMLKGGATVPELAARAEILYEEVFEVIDLLRARGLNVVQTGDMFRIEKTMPIGNVGEFVAFKTDANHRIKFGLSSDKHVGSKYHRTDVLDALYGWFAEEGVAAVLDAGNYIEGESRFNRYDIDTHGLDAQAQKLVAALPKYIGLVTYAVSGDDHEGWYAQREGLDVGRYVESTFRQHGRNDWVNLGYMEAYVDIVNAQTGAISKVLIIHPGGGSAYATSYKPQKIVEGFEGGEKPAALIIGHYHKLSVNLIRNVWAIQCGCAQDQTPFMRKKGIDAHIGGVVAEFEQDPETGALITCKTEIKRFFNQGYYNQRWTPHRGPVLPKREVNREPVRR